MNLKDLMKDEKKAPGQYNKFMKTIPNKEKFIIRKIIKDEKNHLLSLKALKRRLK